MPTQDTQMFASTIPKSQNRKMGKDPALNEKKKTEKETEEMKRRADIRMVN